MKLNTIDKLMIFFFISRTILTTILWSDVKTLVFMLGQGLDYFGAYFFARVTLQNFTDYDKAIKTIIIVSIPVTIFMLVEQLTGGYNVFSLMGGVPEWSAIREGRLRAQGAFSHSILAGTFGATLLPLSWGLWQRNSRLLPVVGVITSLVITWASSSSGPVMTYLFCIFGLCFWLLEKHTKTVRNLFFLLIIVLHFAMSGPIWHLISRIDIVGGSTGYYRYLLIDAAIRNFKGWFLVGIKTTEVWGPGLWDITNQYLLEGSRGGIIPVILFVSIMIMSFKYVGISRASLTGKYDLQKYIWSFGVILFAYSFTFFSVSFFGQMVFFYYLLIALISSLYSLPEIINQSKS